MVIAFNKKGIENLNMISLQIMALLLFAVAAVVIVTMLTTEPTIWMKDLRPMTGPFRMLILYGIRWSLELPWVSPPYPQAPLIFLVSVSSQESDSWVSLDYKGLERTGLEEFLGTPRFCGFGLGWKGYGSCIPQSDSKLCHHRHPSLRPCHVDRRMFESDALTSSWRAKTPQK